MSLSLSRLYSIAVLLLVARLTLQMETPLRTLRSLSWFLLTVLVAEAAHFLIVLPVLYWVFTRRNPFIFLFGVTRALVMALASSDR